MTETMTANGIDVQALVETSKAIADDFTHADSEDQSRAAAFFLHGDEPPVLLGANRGPNAVELLLQGLAFCYAVGFVANAAAKGIEITHLDYEAEGDLDVRRFLGLDGQRAGFTAIRARARVSSPNATLEQLEELCRYVQETSPVRDSLVNPVPVETTLEIV